MIVLKENVPFADSDKFKRYPHVWCLVHDQKEGRNRIVRGDYLKLHSKGRK